MGKKSDGMLFEAWVAYYAQMVAIGNHGQLGTRDRIDQFVNGIDVWMIIRPVDDENGNIDGGQASAPEPEREAFRPHL